MGNFRCRFLFMKLDFVVDGGINNSVATICDKCGFNRIVQH